MKPKNKIVLAGGTGFIGQVLTHYFQAIGYEVVILSRRAQPQTEGIEYVQWDGKSQGPWMVALEGAKALINLSGRSVDCRYTPENQAAIFASRLEPTALLGEAIAMCDQPPKVWINLSTATIYRHEQQRPNDEVSGILGDGFSVEVAKQWEQALNEAMVPGTRKIALRSALVLGIQGGPWPVLRTLSRWGLGGAAGPGNQYVSWIHELDLARMVHWLMEHPKAEGVYNAAAPDPLRNRLFMKVLRHSVGRKLGLPIPTWAVKLGAWVRGTEAELLLKSRWAVPTRAQQEGFQFQFPTWAGAARDLAQATPSDPGRVDHSQHKAALPWALPERRKASAPHWG